MSHGGFCSIVQRSAARRRLMSPVCADSSVHGAAPPHGQTRVTEVMDWHKALSYHRNTACALRACEKIPPRLRPPLNVSGRVADPPISGHIELATLPDIGTPAPCLKHLGAPSLRAGIISQAPSRPRRVPHRRGSLVAEFIAIMGSTTSSCTLDSREYYTRCRRGTYLLSYIGTR